MLHHNHLEIHQRETEGIVILDLDGKLVLGAGDSVLSDRVHALFNGDNRRLILNLAAISEIDTTGMGVLLTEAEEYLKAGGKIVLYNIAHAHGQIYEMARLESAIEIYRDELDAVNSFFPDRKTARYDILTYIESQQHAAEEKK
jgi:anti-sigma B factor antagonist